jgi:hypothetical protein
MYFKKITIYFFNYSLFIFIYKHNGNPTDTHTDTSYGINNLLKKI